jgi:uncharacterized protein YabE (DUF348 family)
MMIMMQPHSTFALLKRDLALDIDGKPMVVTTHAHAK